jgi:hypothetical protein
MTILGEIGPSSKTAEISRLQAAIHVGIVECLDDVSRWPAEPIGIYHAEKEPVRGPTSAVLYTRMCTRVA